MLVTVRPIRILSLAMLAVTCALCWQTPLVSAQGIRDLKGPAEVPPASYTGRQYVDSKGCVFVRAGLDGAVTWVPRVAWSRQQICGAVPTKVADTGPTPRAARTPEPTILPPAPDLNPATTEAAVVAPRPAATPVATPAPRPQPAPAATARAATPERTAAPRVVVPAARRVEAPAARTPVPAAKPVTPAAPPAPRVASAPTACSKLSPVAQGYVRPGEGVRCGPQTAPPAGKGAGPAKAAVATAGATGPVITGKTRVVPRHVAVMQAQSADLPGPPPGYRTVWDDDRLNPRRAHQTLDGRAQMYLRWTRDVPQRLIDIRTGADVTAFNPDLVYPFVSHAAQDAASAAAAQGRRVVVVSSQSGQPLLTSAARNPAAASDRKARVSTSAPQPQIARPAYVQVASFANPANAAATTARLQSMGLPVAAGRLTRGGKPITVVLTGPFTTETAINSALGRARSAGFADAFVRR